MQKILYVISFLCLCIFPAIGNEVASESSVPVSNPKEAADFIKKLVKEALDIVNNSSESEDEKRKKLSECINKYLDIERITKSVFSPLGYKNLSEEDKKKVENYERKYLIRFYAGEGKLAAMMNAKLSNEPVAESKGSDFAVATQFEKNSNPSAKIVWITDGRKVSGVDIEGMSQIITLRSEMKAAVGSGTLMEYINTQD